MPLRPGSLTPPHILRLLARTVPKELTRKNTSKKTSKPRKFFDSPDPYELLSRNFQRCVRLKEYFDVAQPPTISDVEVVVCFCDIRGFTRYCHSLQRRSLDNKIQNFLKAYLEIFAFNVLESIWVLEPADENDPLDEETAQLRDIIIPVTYKNLGDGMMVVWEIPPGTPEVVQGYATHRILEIVLKWNSSFNARFRDPGEIATDSYSDSVSKLGIGFGISRGHAWRLDFGRHLKFDYAGSIVNLAARLQSRARPEGVMCQSQFSPTLLRRLVQRKLGKEINLRGLKGLGAEKAVFFQSKEVAALMKKPIMDWLK